MGNKWVKNGTRAGPIFPIFPKGNLLPHRAVKKKPSIQVSGWKNGENGGIRRYPENWNFLGLQMHCSSAQVCVSWRCRALCSDRRPTVGPFEGEAGVMGPCRQALK